MGARRRRADPDDEAQAQADLREVLRRDRRALQLTREEERAGEAATTAFSALEALNRGDLDAFWAHFADDVFFSTDRAWPGGGEFDSLNGLQHFASQFFDSFGWVEFEPDGEPNPVGSCTIIRGNWHGTGASSGATTLSAPVAVVVRETDGKIDQFRFFFSYDEARELALSLT